MLAIVAAYVLRHSAANDPSPADDLGGAWAYLVNPVVFGLVSVAVGSFLRSNGAAIGVSLGISLGSGIVTGRDREPDQRDGRGLPPARRVATSSPSSTAARTSRWPRPSPAVVVWLVAFLGAGLWRVLRDEY